MNTWAVPTPTNVLFKLAEFSKQSPAPISIQEFLARGEVGAIQDKESFNFLFKEMTIRLAHTITDMWKIPPELLEMDDSQFVIQQYTLSFAELLEFQGIDPVNDHQLEEFANFLITFEARHEDTVAKMAGACMDLATQRGMMLSDVTCPLSMSVKYYLDRLYTSMISLDMITRHLAICGHQRVLPNQSGIINPETKLTSVLVDCYDEATIECENNFMVAPKLIIQNYNATDPDHDVDEPVSGIHIPFHLHTIFYEVLKNSMRATVEHHWHDKDNLPPITAIVCQSNDDFSIKISDQGGGVARHHVEKMFFYLYTTNKKSVSGKSLGSGLPIAQLYARYFHGDLRIASYEGYGTDVYIYIRALASKDVERLPMYVPGDYKRKEFESDMGEDWTSKFEGHSYRL